MKNKRLVNITAAALLCAPLAVFAAKAANVGHYGAPTGLLGATNASLITSKSANNNGPSFTLTNLTNHNVYFEIAGTTGSQPLPLYAKGSQQGSNVYIVNGSNANVTWIYNDPSFTSPYVDEQPLVFQTKQDSYGNFYDTNYYISH
ncbi:MAG: hypothetical protein P1U34_03095 [Coxiellaceae bacterium]|nr:hypothetical protein [Coxiellaceae bacterium]